METIAMILTPLEMLLVNLFVIHRCSQRKYGLKRTYMGMGLFIFVLMYLSLLIARSVPGFGDGNGLFIFSGFMFIIPIKLLYRVNGMKIVTIACYSWIYTFLLFALSAKFGRVLSMPWFSLPATVLLLQTILYLISFKWFYSMLQSRFVYILEHIGKKEAVALMLMCMMWFWTVFIFNLSFTYTDFRFLQILSFLTLAVCILSSFRYISLQVNSSKTLQTREKIAYRDELTQLRSRVVLGSDTEELINRCIPFYLVFFDLDDFKSINDRYGHLVGDRYLAFFAYEIKVRIGNRGGFYRIAGDEFVCIFSDSEIKAFLDDIAALPKTLPDSNVKFLGFSYGIAVFPRDGGNVEELLQCADQHMYEMKRATKSARRSRIPVKYPN
jgi:diguanylate cyclase (GGDEF)-like protein